MQVEHIQQNLILDKACLSLSLPPRVIFYLHISRAHITCVFVRLDELTKYK